MGGWLSLSSDVIGADQSAAVRTDPLALALPRAIRRAALHVGISWLFLFGLAAPALFGAQGLAYFLFEPLNAGVVFFASASIVVVLRTAWRRQRQGRRTTFLVDLPVSGIAGAVASFLTFELLAAQLSPLDRNQVGTLQLFYWFACIPGGFTIAAQILLLASASHWGLAKAGLRWPLLTGLVGAAGLPIVASTWLYSSRETPLWPVGVVLVLVAAASDFVICCRPQYTPRVGIGFG